MRTKGAKPFLPIVLFFLLLNGFLLFSKNLLSRWNIDQDVLILGNLILFVITLLSFIVGQKGVRNPNAHAFVRSVYGGIMLKLFLCIAAAFIYIASFGKSLNKPALFACMALYLVYTFIEITALTKLLKQKTNAEERSAHT
jgi:hypothetical protein